MYLPYWQNTEPGMNVVLKTAATRSPLAAGLRAAVKAIDPDMPVAERRADDAHRRGVDRAAALPRILVAIFAALAMVLAAIGIYGVMSYAVAQRTTEIGVRMALGADRRAVFALVVARRPDARGERLAIGAGRLARAGPQPHDAALRVAPADPLTFAATAAGLLAVALAANVLPARRATRVDPMTALRGE